VCDTIITAAVNAKEGVSVDNESPPCRSNHVRALGGHGYEYVRSYRTAIGAAIRAANEATH
jgi:hypothetical protein